MFYLKSESNQNELMSILPVTSNVSAGHSPVCPWTEAERDWKGFFGLCNVGKKNFLRYIKIGSKILEEIKPVFIIYEIHILRCTLSVYSHRLAVL